MTPIQEVCADLRNYGANRSAVLAEHDRRAEMAQTDPLLAVLYFIEAAGDRRVECDVIAPSVLTDIRDRARTAIERHTSQPFRNPLYR